MEVILPPLHPKQREVAECQARFIVLCSGRRWGKTRLGSVLCIANALQGKRAWWVGPNYPTASVGWRTVRSLALQIPGAEIREGDRRVTSPGGGWVQIRSADAPESLRGEGLDLIVVDEAAHITKFVEAWEQALRPALSDRQGRGLFISTPKSYNHFYDLFKFAENNEDWASFQFPTWDNPYIPQGEIEAARQQLPSLVFRQEYGAEFVQLVGAMFQREWMNVTDTAPECRYVRHWDIAISTKTTGDYTVGAKVGLTKDGTLAIADVVRGRWEWPDAVKVISSTARADGSAVAQGIEWVGTQGGMLQTLRREPSLVGITLRPVKVEKDKITRAAPLLARAEQGKLVLVRGGWNTALIDEFCAFPEGTHDDQVDAVSGAVQMLAKSTGGVWRAS